MDDLRVTRTLRIPLAELTWRTSTSGGPGGQHANTAQTRVEVVFDVAASASLGPRQRSRLLARIGPRVTATAGDTRSQQRNRDLALDRLRSKLAEAIRERPPRRPTQPSAAAAERRLEAKRRRGERKAARRPVRPED